MSDSTVISDFSSIPILDYSLLDSPSQRPKFIAQLQHALINIGFLYLSNHPVSTADIDSLIQYIPKLFALPQEAKDKIRMANSEHFLGYSRLGAELTKGKVDQREQFDFATRHVCRWKEGDPEYYRLWGPSQVCMFRCQFRTCICSLYTTQWPDEDLFPGFRDTMERYLNQVQDLSYKFSSLLAEAFGLSPNGLAHFYDTDELMQHRSKIVRYPVIKDGDDDQGVGPHYDAGFLTFVESLSAVSHFHTYLPRRFFSSCKHRHIVDCKSRIFQESGLTHHPFRALSLSTSEKVVSALPCNKISTP